jgi:hypothetical protein
MGSRVRQIRQQLGLAFAVALCALLSGAVSGSTDNGVVTKPPGPEFRLARLMYDSNGLGGGRGGFGRGGSWAIDAPEAEFFLSQGIRRLTRINVYDPGPDADVDDVLPVHLLDEDLFDRPFIYGVEVGHWFLDDEEAARLREYLERGGFLMVDDFHGTEEWIGFMESFQLVFPDRDVVDIPPDHEVFHVLYDVSQKVRDKKQIYGIQIQRSGREYERDGYVPQWKGVFDDNGRLMVAINHNMDLGDSWEHADISWYAQELTALGYRFAISYALYAMTH